MSDLKSSLPLSPLDRQEASISTTRLIMQPTVSKADLEISSNLRGPTTSPAPMTKVINCVGVLAFGTIANSIVGALTGLLGSLIWQHDRRVVQMIVIIGGLAGGIGGLLHAIFIVNGKLLYTGEGDASDRGENEDFGRVFVRVFSQAPFWSVIGASIGFGIARNSSLHDITFTLVIFTALAGTLGFAIYAMAMCWLTGSYSHLLILQNQVLVLAEKLEIWNDSDIQSVQSPIPYNPLMPEFESLPRKAKQMVIDMKEQDQ
ncbi:hypothetical protein PGT21_007294 [Puccinia graminis f. sp. tritici]|uniref:Uncharacterized protein n=1 Tax=Puccinia graminis f. sp. tritici TaxID=56615 RepID=A0A5B0PVF5_PUCGR|nr:hypothetical protein PGTUg99_007517 [Puccinia graminis f. sp. tritici]KAA1104009.1 hypothetical protein PGT21_007294 [Puccinia graminis f. sp. tritici]